MGQFPTMKAKRLLAVLQREPLNYRVSRQSGSYRRMEAPGRPPLTFASMTGQPCPPASSARFSSNSVGISAVRAPRSGGPRDEPGGEGDNPRMANAYQPDFDADQDREGFTYRRAKLGQQAKSEKLGASLYDIPPGQATFPYHAHSANEEMLIVLSGQPHLRTPDGWRELAEGEIVAFRVGEEGAHQLQNRGAQHARVLVVSTMIAPEVNLYPDTGKLVAATRAPGASDEGFQEAYRREQATDYWTDEEPPDS